MGIVGLLAFQGEQAVPYVDHAEQKNAPKSLSDREVVVLANTNGSSGFAGKVLVDIDLSRMSRTMKIAYSNKGTVGTQTTSIAPGTLYAAGHPPVAMQVASLPVSLAAWEVQILTPL